jgi:dihydroflavonol-4-reductase
MTVDGLSMSRYRMYFSSEKARRELGYQPRAYQEGLRDALDWFRAAGYLH